MLCLREALANLSSHINGDCPDLALSTFVSLKTSSSNSLGPGDGVGVGVGVRTGVGVEVGVDLEAGVDVGIGVGVGVGMLLFSSVVIIEYVEFPLDVLLTVITYVPVAAVL